MWRIVLFSAGIIMAGCATNRTRAPHALYDILWQWEGTDAPGDACVVPTPQRYTLRFLPEGKLQVKLDCNNGGGSYTMSAGTLSFGPLMSTRRACEPGSLDGRYMKDLQRVVAFYVQDGVLALELSGDAGTMRFRRAVDQPREK